MKEFLKRILQGVVPVLVIMLGIWGYFKVFPHGGGPLGSSSNWSIEDKKNPLDDSSVSTAITSVKSEGFSVQVKMTCTEDKNRKHAFAMMLSFFDNDDKGESLKILQVPSGDHTGIPDRVARMNLRVGDAPMEKLQTPYNDLPYGNGMNVCFASKQVGTNPFSQMMSAIAGMAKSMMGNSPPCLSDKSLVSVPNSKSLAINLELDSGSPTFIVDYSADEPRKVVNMCKDYFTVAKTETDTKSAPSEQPATTPQQESAAPTPDAASNDTVADVESCVAKKIEEFRQEQGADAVVRSDMSDEWEGECKTKK